MRKSNIYIYNSLKVSYIFATKNGHYIIYPKKYVGAYLPKNGLTQTKKCHISSNKSKLSKCSITSSNSSFALTGVSLNIIGMS